ncbi:unnamed protein product, partial [Prorocentrum cordatum]
EFPCVHKVFQMMGCGRYLCQCGKFHSRSGRLLGIGVAMIMGPLAAIWSCVVFLLLGVPLVALVFLWHPARMSRFGAFLAGLACGIYGLVLAVHNLITLCLPDIRPTYAVTWPLAGSDCICGCVYPLNSHIVGQFAIIGAITVVKSLFLSFRCLKGLRRRNWANLLSVTFPVPVTAYAVEWVTPEGHPIKYRDREGPMKPVQGELAFDPFAMMDEQPDSAATSLHLRPVKTRRIMYNRRGKERPLRTLEGPNARAQEYTDRGQEYIGCCGFPCITSGKKGHFELEGDDCEAGDSTVSRRASLDSSVNGADLTRRDSAKGCMSMDSIESLGFNRMDTRDTGATSSTTRTGWAGGSRSTSRSAGSRTGAASSTAPARSTRDTAARRLFDAERLAGAAKARGVQLDDSARSAEAERSACASRWGRAEPEDERDRVDSDFLDSDRFDSKETEFSQPQLHWRSAVEAGGLASAPVTALQAFDDSVASL